MHDPEITRIVGKESYDSLSFQEKVKYNIRFNESIQELQRRLPGGFPGIPMGVYRFKTPEEADAQIEQAILRVAAQR